jgi:hypothetical protein
MTKFRNVNNSCRAGTIPRSGFRALAEPGAPLKAQESAPKEAHTSLIMTTVEGIALMMGLIDVIANQAMKMAR